MLFPALAFLGLVTFDRTLQNSVEDIGYAHRIDLCRRFYVDAWPMLSPYLYQPRLREDGVVDVRSGAWQLFLTVAGVMAIITSLLAGAFAGLLARVAAGGSIPLASVAGVAAAAVTLTLLHRQQRQTFAHADFERMDPQMHRRPR